MRHLRLLAFGLVCGAAGLTLGCKDPPAPPQAEQAEPAHFAREKKSARDAQAQATSTLSPEKPQTILPDFPIEQDLEEEAMAVIKQENLKAELDRLEEEIVRGAAHKQNN